MLTAELIRRKRDGGELSAEEIEQLVFGIADGSVTDAQVGALAMAIVLNGMTSAERIALTGAMRDSGDVLDWADAGLSGPVLDKHSTGVIPRHTIAIASAPTWASVTDPSAIPNTSCSISSALSSPPSRFRRISSAVSIEG